MSFPGFGFKLKNGTRRWKRLKRNPMKTKNVNVRTVKWWKTCPYLKPKSSNRQELTCLIPSDRRRIDQSGQTQARDALRQGNHPSHIWPQGQYAAPSPGTERSRDCFHALDACGQVVSPIRVCPPRYCFRSMNIMSRSTVRYNNIGIWG